jgi:hypothetical protein
LSGPQPTFALNAHERKRDTLRSGSGAIVKSKMQAIGISLSKARKAGKKGARKENVPPNEEVERRAVVCDVLLRNDAASDATLAATVLRLIRVVVPALMYHERSASDLREL